MMKGLNLIGYATSPTGLGEDLRSFAAMLDYLDISYSVIDVPTESSGKVKPEWQRLTQETYLVSFFFMSPMECLRLQEVHPQLFLEPRIKVGYFLWELPDFPEDFIPALNLVDQIWCPTKFVQQAFFSKVKKLTLAIPLPVITSEKSGRNFRKELAIPKDAFVVLNMFDIRSTLKRKNPQATIEAFIKFAQDKPNAYLILKINRWQQVDKKLFSWIPNNPKVKIIIDTLNNNELTDLYQAADVYLSLHRSEGFGRTLVEAMQHGLELISINYSGPKDYLDPSCARLVTWYKKSVLEGDYPYTKGSSWAEPSVTSAVVQLNAVFNEKDTTRKALIKAAGNQFSVESLAKRYKPVLMTYLR